MGALSHSLSAERVHPSSPALRLQAGLAGSNLEAVLYALGLERLGGTLMQSGRATTVE